MAIKFRQKHLYIWRAMQLLLALVLLGYIIYLNVDLNYLASKSRTEQTQMFGSTLTSRAAQDAATFLQNEQTEELDRLVASLAADPLVRDATIYNHLGEIIHQSEDPASLDLVLHIKPVKSSSDARESAHNRIPYVAELYQEKQKIGYLRVTLEQGKILQQINNYQSQARSSTKTMLVLAFLVGFLITRNLSKKRRWWQQVMHKAEMARKSRAI
ncbi:hypothetical protein D1Z90_00950 [Motilimonas pumila]|uniref:Smp protein n=2 Tax=Motilimonas pumila TaxID=2303987 RepID=A0A418YK23_9GAMM|nr:hypothetical protein D1Z90_00950 [Motilimonas pumila]